MREGIINRCFQTVDANNDDIITIADLRYVTNLSFFSSPILSASFIYIRRSYSVERHPLYENGDEDKEEIMARFLATFEEGDNLSAEVRHFEFFFLMTRQ